MNEVYLQYIASSKIAWIAAFSLFYGLGGISGKWKRRFIGAAWMLAGVILFSILTKTFHYWYIAYLPLVIGALHVGYGDKGTNSKTFKTKRRAITGLCLALSALPLCFGNNLWALYGCHVVLCLLSSIFLGVYNPAKNARDEETLIATMSSIIPLFLV